MWFGRGETGLCFNFKASCKMEPDCDTWKRKFWEKCREQGRVLKQLGDLNPSAAKEAATDPCRPSQPTDYCPWAKTRHLPSNKRLRTNATTLALTRRLAQEPLWPSRAFTSRLKASAIKKRDKNTDAKIHIFHSLMALAIPAKRSYALSSRKEEKKLIPAEILAPISQIDAYAHGECRTPCWKNISFLTLKNPVSFTEKLSHSLETSAMACFSPEDSLLV